MAEFELAPRSPLGGIRQDFGGVSLSEPAGLGIAAIAVPRGGDAALADAVRAVWGMELPTVGRYSIGTDGLRLIGMSPDQFFAVFPCEGPDAARIVATALGEAAWVTEQSDAWAVLDLEGPGVRAALERVCPLDLHPDLFAADLAQRTLMEHLSVIVMRLAEDRFRLMSPSSSALSFLHMVETSARNIVRGGDHGA
ncbi:sarcosine oxidase subunit gamma [Minwuia thermotolerans]|uniref:Sarcosine oxidase subunit gamma n=1 Tax=Minwuia thermotolerans TaxID=2056226 RepID=A0A2M9FVW6_9PROT|nr:sarcosine oxidase subunit gamma family protein [Minwuia thermotolerans]PJK27583.1 sarcosine oxidase subunit gamma [Minwuia thermotolerans]